MSSIPRFIEHSSLLELLADMKRPRTSTSTSGNDDLSYSEEGTSSDKLPKEAETVVFSSVRTVPVDQINLADSFVVFISYVGQPRCESMLFLLVEALMKIRTTLAPKMSKCYIWMDSLCSLPRSELSSPPAYESILSVCDMMLTPMYDPYVGSVTQLNVAECDKKYTPRPWNFGPTAYLNRGKLSFLGASMISRFFRTHLFIYVTHFILTNTHSIAWCRLEMLCNYLIENVMPFPDRREKLSKSFNILQENTRARCESFPAKLHLVQSFLSSK